MTAFDMHLYGATQHEHVERVTSFVGEDASGTFGIQARHGRMMTVLAYGPGALPHRRSRLALPRLPRRRAVFCRQYAACQHASLPA
ncbi:MAG: hypothetical protein M5R42_05105 [Rhodocyclaceae bacterium]|nr:hypothetical protein [Rhodocyclaceae bacterium]